jgi:hypothetical protein
MLEYWKWISEIVEIKQLLTLRWKMNDLYSIPKMIVC